MAPAWSFQPRQILNMFFTVGASYFLLLLLHPMCSCHAMASPHQNSTLPVVHQSGGGSDKMAQVYLAADDQCELYVNGERQIHVVGWRWFGYASFSVSDGDVISIVARDRHSYYGVIVELLIDGMSFVTGRDEFRSVKEIADLDDEWKTPSFSRRQSCSWPVAQVRPNPETWNPGKAVNFNLPTAAKYVWAKDAGESDNIFMRFVVGESRCTAKASIFFSADNSAEVYLNGEFIGSNSDWRLFSTVPARLRHGDVVSVKVKDFGVWWGAIASIKIGSEYLSTGRDDWRAVKAFPITGNVNAWMLPSYNACRWPKAVLRPRRGEIIPGKARDFPYDSTGASYVWAADAGINDEIWLRTVIGVQC